MEKPNEKTTEEKKRANLRDMFEIAKKLPEKDLARLEGVITGMQLATAEKAG